MKEYALELARAQSSDTDKLNILREYLQTFILKILHDKGAFRTTAFVGGNPGF